MTLNSPGTYQELLQAFLAGRPRAELGIGSNEGPRLNHRCNRNPAPEINSLNPGSHHSISAPSVHWENIPKSIRLKSRSREDHRKPWILPAKYWVYGIPSDHFWKKQKLGLLTR